MMHKVIEIQGTLLVLKHIKLISKIFKTRSGSLDIYIFTVYLNDNNEAGFDFKYNKEDLAMHDRLTLKQLLNQ